MGMHEKKGKYLSYLLRHHPEACHLDMDKKGYVDVQQLISNVNEYSHYSLTFDELQEIVETDDKQRFKLAKDKIKCNQGHSIPWVEPELDYDVVVPDTLYHGTTAEAYEKIKKDGCISKMKRHAVHLQQDIKKAWKSAKRWHNQIPIVLEIDSKQMNKGGYSIGVTDNDVWCVESVPIKYIKKIYEN